MLDVVSKVGEVGGFCIHPAGGGDGSVDVKMGGMRRVTQAVDDEDGDVLQSGGHAVGHGGAVGKVGGFVFAAAADDVAEGGGVAVGNVDGG